VVGLNQFTVEETIELEQLKVDPAIEHQQRQRLADLRARRDSTRAAELLGHLETAARSDTNLMPVLIECVSSHLTLGEICTLLRRTWGEYQPAEWL